MRPDDRRDQRPAQGGIPDGLLIGILAFLLGMTLLVWTATGLAALFAHGSWPDGVSFTGTPQAMRQLIAEPHDIPGAWPDAPGTALSGYGLFWGLFIGQLMVLVVLTVFVMGTVARWRAVRQRRREAPTPASASASTSTSAPEPAPVAQETPVQETPVQDEPVHEVPTPRAPQQAPPTTPAPQAPVERAAPSASAATGKRMGGWATNRAEGAVHYGSRDSRHEAATDALRDAEGAALVITSNPGLWSETKDARAKLGPAHVYDPNHLCDTPARFHWSPTAGCEDRPTATARAAALLTPVRPTARLDQAVADTAELLLRCYLHAAAIDGRTVRHVHRWSQGLQVQDAVRILRTHPKAAPGSAGELEGSLTAHPERRDMAQQLTARALAALSTVNIREACTPNRNDALALDSFVDEQGTLYVVGESIEDPRTSPGAMPLLTALVSSVVERGRRMAERSSSGRLDPPMTLVLDDVAAVAPLPQLPELLATGTDIGMPTLALLRSREQGRARWPHDELPV
ncbi:type VI secretion protein [Streptomyces tendae]|uniref:Type VI secretion protein n=1 Tax=Streptomyces tendae TaxID=1932 RepID=A0A6B3QV79_STRTE|nr:MULTISPECIES: type IV secretory system conjugative DNA transfer family protein [Streptomyces]MBQ0969538.1 type VI secretion protein [Streptomyces sp. RK74B]MBQ1009285.1 type VI secretion protein [Streptomyces sp. RK23]MZG19847.1 type VI secretion protein [Streptomyces sp. SID5914]NEV89994.1 type VI secretion protein [Streptomyces tendae]